MSQEIKVPKLGDNIEAADVVSVLVNIGDSITVGQGLIELESDKASVEVPSEVAGVIQELRVSPGDRVNVGQVIMILSSDAAPVGVQNIEPLQDAKTPSPAVTPPATQPDTSSGKDDRPVVSTGGSTSTPVSTSTPSNIDVRVPNLGDTIKSAAITRVLVAVGDTISTGQGLIELESDKASIEVPSPASGKIVSLAVAEGDQVTVDQVILVLSSDAPSPAATPSPVVTSPPPVGVQNSEPLQVAITAPTPTPAPTATVSASEPTGNPVPAAPSVRRFARELGVNIRQVPGSGPGGRISQDDVKAFIKAAMLAPPKTVSSSSSLALPDMPDFSRFGEVKAEKMSNVRRATARQMTLSWQQIPHVTQFDQADITDVEVFRKAQAKRVEAAGGKLTVTAILLKLCALALKKYPQFNASIDLKNEQIIFKSYVNIGVAVDTPRGLVVPVLRNVANKGLIDLAVELGEVGKKARDKKLSPDDMQGACFTISNLGGLGTTYFTPIVNWPEVAILGVGRASQQPVWKDSSFVPRLIMPLSISYDHRLIDGADAARFLRFLAETLENPLSLLMDS